MHLSTGGSPRWLCELIKESMLQNEVFVAEFNNYGNFDIQKNEIINLIGKKSHECIGPCFSDNWKEEKNRLLKIIEEFKPHVIHFNEIPENFEYNGFPEELLEKIYKKDRDYEILETCHSNNFDFSKKKHHPDGYVCVSEYHPPKIRELFPDTPCYIWDYDIPEKKRPDRSKALVKLGLDPNKFHVLNVGLFHENKNQKYIYDLAKKILGEEVEFHFLGNECYKENCEIDNLDSPNCKIWGEKDNVDDFYSSMDLFLFPSKRELNPLCVKEALSWGIPVFMNKIESCELYKKYEDNKNVTFINGENTEEYIRSKINKPKKKEGFRIALYTSFFNNAKYIPGLYKQISNQTHQDWKWFVTDDFSKDGAVEKELLGLASSDKRVVFCEQKTKKEMFWNPQHFVTEDCDYLALVDADDGIYPKALEFLSHMLKKNPEAFSFSTWFHQYDKKIDSIDRITNSDFSYPQGDWHTYLNKHEEDLKKGGFDWGYLRSFRFFGCLRGHKNIKDVEINIDKPEKSVYEDSTRMSILQKYGHYVLFPRPMYKVRNHNVSHASSHNMDPEEHRVSKSNYLKAVENGKIYTHNKILDNYYPFFDELSALSLSNIHHEKDRKNLCLITNRPITKRQSDDIQDLYFDHDFHVNTFNDKVDYYFLNVNSFKEDELKDIFQKLYNLNGDFEINAYYLLEKEDKSYADEAVKLMNRIANKEGFSWNLFCRNLIFKTRVRSKPKAYIEIGSSCLGDNLAWIPYVEEFRKKNNYEVYCFSYLQDLYAPNYPEIKFLNSPKGAPEHKWDKVHKIGWYKDTPIEIKQKEQQRAASHYLQLDHKEIKPKVFVENKERAVEGKYVCIAVQSSAQCKYWNNPTGWDQVTGYLNSKGYKVVCIDKHSSFGGKDRFNYIPDGAINKTGDFPLQERATDLYNCDFFIGLGSGLSWLAWGLNKEVVLISGFSDEKTEFHTPYRVINKNVCNSCWNRHEFDANNWNWCPDHEGTDREFECSKQITFEMVKEQIDKVILKSETYSSNGPDWWRDVYQEVIERNVYQIFYQVEKGDYVVDLGSSRGPFYHVNRGKDIEYLGVEAFQDNIDALLSSLTEEERPKVRVLNKFFKENSNKERIIIKEGSEVSNFTELKNVEVDCVDFEGIIKESKGRKIDFLKFDIEGEEIKMFDKSYELILSNVRKMSGEVHSLKYKESGAIKLIKKLRDDPRVELGISSINGVDITESFWAKCEGDRHTFYTEVIVSSKNTI